MKRVSIEWPPGRWLKGSPGRQKKRAPEPDERYVGIPTNLADDVELVSRIENITWKEAANLLIEDAFRQYESAEKVPSVLKKGGLRGMF